MFDRGYDRLYNDRIIHKGLSQLEGKESARSAGIDLIKTLAIIFVVCVHFSLNTQYYSASITDLNMYIQTFLRWIFVVCVPLFLISTGYLNHNKTPSKSYYIKILRVLIPYVVISIVCVIIKEIKSPDPVNLKNDIFSIFNFTADSYSWYVNMFIGLFLIAPFLNMLFNHLDRKKVLLLLGILLFMISLPLTFNPLATYSPKFAYFYFPNFWDDGYPLIYYFIGAYIAKYQPKVNRLVCVSVALALVLLQTVILILAQPYLKNNWLLTEYGSIFIIPESVCIFLLLFNMDIKAQPVKRALKTVSSVTLEMFLISFIFDQFFYNYFFGFNVFISQEQFFSKYFLIIVPLVLVLSFVAALILHGAYALGEITIKKRFEKKKALHSSV